MKSHILGAVVLCAAAGSAYAGPIDVNYTITGSAGSWTLDFKVKNNLNPAGMDVYFFGVLLDTGRNIVGSPAVYDPNQWTSWDNSGFGGSSTVYNNNWIDLSGSYAQLPAGNSLSGFKALYTGATAPSGVQFFAFGFDPAGGVYSGTDYFNQNWNPGFEGVAHPVPAPTAMGLIAVGGLASLRRRR